MQRNSCRLKFKGNSVIFDQLPAVSSHEGHLIYNSRANLVEASLHMAVWCCIQLCSSSELGSHSKAAQVHFELIKMNLFHSF